METIVAEQLFDPPSAGLKYLPEGPIWIGEQRISWVAIQHAADAEQGSLNILDLATGENQSWQLPGRPGFAFPTQQAGVFLLGLERQLQQFDTATGEFRPLADEVDAAVEGTIINDGISFAEGIVFGTKDLTFSEQKAGLYFWREADQQLIQLRDDQVCSNGKVIRQVAENDWLLLDIDTPTQTVVQYRLDTAAGSLSPPDVVLDLTHLDIFPDGMVGTPDGQGVIIAFYNPQDAPFGVVHQYGLAEQDLQIQWHLPGSPQVTCPLLIERAGAVQLIATTATENMPADKLARYPMAGCLYAAATPHRVAPLDYKLPAR
jgi:sugar lactone lactonase YvrE